LSPLIRRKEIGSLRRYMSIAQASDLPFRMDETNTVSCGGVAGVSDTFASALWAAGYLPQVMAAGVAGVNLHGNVMRCSGYSPLCAIDAEDLATGTLGAQPEWYALLLAKQLLGDRPLPTRVRRATRGTNVRASAFLAEHGGLEYAVVDDDPPGSRDVAVRLPVGAGFSGASVLSLTAPSPSSLDGVRLGGRAVEPDGSWQPANLPRVKVRGGVIDVKLAPSSAALISVSRVG
jgi:hypothetical protein